MNWYTHKLFLVLIVGLIYGILSVTSAYAETSVLHDGNALEYTDPPDVVAYANTEYVEPPPEFEITTSGANWPSGPIWRYNHAISLMDTEGWVEAETTVVTDTVGIQFLGDTNDGWARVLVDGSEVWAGSVYGSDAYYPGNAFVKYLEISGLENTTHTIRVENMGINGDGGGDDATIAFFGLGDTSGITKPAEEGLVAHYTFDNNYEDSSAYSNHGTPMRNMDFSAGVVGNASAVFDGQSYIEVEDSDSLDLTDDFTFSVWLNKEDAGVGGWAVVLCKGDNASLSASDSPYALYHYNGVYPGVRAEGQHISSNAETNYNEWYLLTVTREGNDFKFYINGELKDTQSSTASTPASTSKLLIGMDPPGSTEYFKGAMDDLRIYNYALSQNEIRALYERSTAPPEETNAVLYDGNALVFTDPPDVVAYPNTEYIAPPPEFNITTAGDTWPDGPIWRYYEVITLMDTDGWVEARTTIATDTVGIQFWGDTNDGWARVLVDGSEVWTGSVYGSDAYYPGNAFVKYLEISGLDNTTHTIRVENMGINGDGGGDDVTIAFFGLEEQEQEQDEEEGSVYNPYG